MVAAALFDGRDTAKGAVRCNVCVSGRGQGGGGGGAKRAVGRIAWVTSGRNACSGTDYMHPGWPGPGTETADEMTTCRLAYSVPT